MKNNRLPQLAGLLVVLIAVAWLTGVFDRDPSTVNLPAIDLSATSVDRVDLDGPGLSVSLVRDPAAGWRLERPVQAAADTQAVGRLVRDLAGARLGSLVSTSPDRHARFGVDSTGTEIVLGLAEARRRFIVSARGPDYASNYLRVDDGAEVYATRDRISVPTDLDRLRDRTAWRIPAATVVRATVDRDEDAFTVERTPGGWALSGGSGLPVPADSISVTSWLRRFDPLTAEGFHADVSADSVRSGAHETVTVTTIDGTTRQFFLLDHDDELAASTDGGTDVFRLYGTRRTMLAPASSTLKSDS